MEKTLQEDRGGTGSTATEQLVDRARRLIRTDRFGPALGLLEDARRISADDPFVMSYHGCLVAIVEKRFDEGIKTCREAIARLQDTDPEGYEFHLPEFYLNLGKAYTAAKKKREAVETFRLGLRNDPKHWDLTLAMNKLGPRQRPPIPFLSRSNFLNRLIGKIRYRLSGRRRAV